MGSSYIPDTDAGYDAWLLNFSTKLTASPTTYGLVTGDATAVAAQYTAWHAAFLAATTPATRTPVTVATKDTQRAATLLIVRPYAVTVSRNSAVSDANKIALGVNPNSSIPTPVPPPSAIPVLNLDSSVPGVQTLRYTNPSSPTSRAKPEGAIALQLFRSTATTLPTDPLAGGYLGAYTKIPLTVENSPGDKGKTARYWARWQNRKGEVGPWSDPLDVTLQ